MYPKRLILDDARQFGITVLGLDGNASEKEYVVERCAEEEESRRAPGEGLPFETLPSSAPEGPPDGRGYGIRLALSEVKGISEAEVDRIVAARPYHSLTDFWHRARVSRPVVERLVLAGGFDSVYGIGSPVAVRRRRKVSRRDLLLQVADLDRHSRAVDRASRGRSRGLSGRSGSTGRPSTGALEPAEPVGAPSGVWERAARQSRATRPSAPVTSVQLALDLGDAPVDGEVSGLPEMSAADRVRAELEILGLDVSRHVVDFYDGFLDELGVTRAKDILRRRSRAELLVAGVKVATQTPPIRSGRRVVFLTLDDSTGPVDATFFEDAQGPYAATVFHSWLLVVRGVLRRTGRQGVSLRATGCWELPTLYQVWQTGGMDAVHQTMARVPAGFTGEEAAESAIAGAAESRSTRPVMAQPPSGMTAGGMGRRRVLVHSSGFKMSPYSDIKPAGEDAKSAPRKLWHSSPGSSGG
jgi:error-prone DNA polymerase